MDQAFRRHGGGWYMIGGNELILVGPALTVEKSLEICRGPPCSPSRSCFTSGVTADRLAVVFLVGGSSRLPLVATPPPDGCHTDATTSR